MLQVERARLRVHSMGVCMGTHACMTVSLNVLLLCALVASGEGMIYGTAWKKDATAKYTLRALHAGFRSLDTANHPKHYNESLVGEAIARSGIERGQLWVQTKFTPDACDDTERSLHPYDERAAVAEQVRQSFSSSLEHLRLEYVESYLLHAPYARVHNEVISSKTVEAWRAMEDLVREGRARRIGVSNIGVGELRALFNAAEIKPSFVQNQCVAASDDWDSGVRNFCAERGIAYQGFRLLTGNQHLLNEASQYEVRRVASVHGVTPEQVVYRFAQQHLGVIPLSGPTQQRHMEDAWRSQSFNLSKVQLQALASMAPPADNRVTVRFHNKLDNPVDIVWISHDEQTRYSQGIILEGNHLELQTYHGHHFVVEEHGENAQPRAVKSWVCKRSAGVVQDVAVDGRVEAAFVNDLAEPIQLFWRQNDGGHRLLGELIPGALHHESARLGHEFVVRSKSKTGTHFERKWIATVLPADFVGGPPVDNHHLVRVSDAPDEL